MRVLLDECVPWPLRHELVGHEVTTQRLRGWSGKKNGELLALMDSAGLDVLLTVDQNLKYQQNFAGRKVAIVVMIARSNRPEALTPLMPQIRAAIDGIKPGDYLEISAPTSC